MFKIVSTIVLNCSTIVGNCLKLFQQLFKIAENYFNNCSKLFRIVSNMVQNCWKLFQPLVQNCWKLFQPLFKIVWNCFKNCSKLFQQVFKLFFLNNCFNSSSILVAKCCNTCFNLLIKGPDDPTSQLLPKMSFNGFSGDREGRKDKGGGERSCMYVCM